MEKNVLWHSFFWLDRIYQALAAARSLITCIGWFGYPTCTFSAYNSILRLRHFSYTRMAYNYLPTLLCCRCYLLRIRNGANFIIGDEESVEIGRLYHYRAY